MNFIGFIILFTFSLSVFMAAGFLVRPIHYRNVIFSLLLLCFGYMHLFIFLIDSQFILQYPHLFFIHHPVMISIGPLLYLYTLSLIGEKKDFQRKDIFHFSGTLSVIILFSPLWIKSADSKREMVSNILQSNLNLFRIIGAVAVAVAIIYTALSLAKIKKNINRNNYGHQKLFLVLILFVLWLIAGMAGFIIAITMCSNMMIFFNLMSAVIIICIFFLDQRYPYLLQFATIPIKQRRYSKSQLNNIDLENLDKQIRILMEEEKLYCDEDLSLSRFSQILEISSHQLSQFLNEYYKKNFNNFINDYRISEAKEFILNDASNNILSIAFAVGFNSYSSFHRVFKKETGLSPAEFRQKNLMK